MCLGRWGRWEWGPEQEKAEGRGRSWKGCDGRGAAGWRAEPKVGRVPPLRSPPHLRPTPPRNLLSSSLYVPRARCSGTARPPVRGLAQAFPYQAKPFAPRITD